MAAEAGGSLVRLGDFTHGRGQESGPNIPPPHRAGDDGTLHNSRGLSLTRARQKLLDETCPSVIRTAVLCSLPLPARGRPKKDLRATAFPCWETPKSHKIVTSFPRGLPKKWGAVFVRTLVRFVPCPAGTTRGTRCQKCGVNTGRRREKSPGWRGGGAVNFPGFCSCRRHGVLSVTAVAEVSSWGTHQTFFCGPLAQFLP